MRTDRSKLLKLEFDAVMDTLQHTEDANERFGLLRQLREIIDGSDEMNLLSQREIRAMRTRLLRLR